jgi:hypothetical protein
MPGAAVRCNAVERSGVGYAIVVVLSVGVGAVVYSASMRRARPHHASSFDRADPEGADAERDVMYVPVTPSAVSWQTRSIGLLGLVALVMVCASAIALALYSVGSLLIRLLIHKLANA